MQSGRPEALRSASGCAGLHHLLESNNLQRFPWWHVQQTSQANSSTMRICTSCYWTYNLPPLQKISTLILAWHREVIVVG